jgi:hypothetical protein
MKCQVRQVERHTLAQRFDRRVLPYGIMTMMRHLAVRICILLAGVLIGAQGAMATVSHSHHAEEPCAVCRTPNDDRRKRIAESTKKEDLQSFDPSAIDSGEFQASQVSTVSTFATVVAAILVGIFTFPESFATREISGPIRDGPDPSFSHPICRLQAPRGPPDRDAA